MVTDLLRTPTLPSTVRVLTSASLASGLAGLLLAPGSIGAWPQLARKSGAVTSASFAILSALVFMISSLYLLLRRGRKKTLRLIQLSGGGCRIHDTDHKTGVRASVFREFRS